MKQGRTMSWYEPGDKIPCAYARCHPDRCGKTWIIPVGIQTGRCVICGNRPIIIEMLPEEEWPVVPGPRRDAQGEKAVAEREVVDD